jgi:hypothetical protein
MLVVDLLHEFELGVWKAIFIHLMCILCTAGGTLIQQLNYRYFTDPMVVCCPLRLVMTRYQRVPTFGRGTIRRFHKNASAIKRLAARDVEDLLQVSEKVPHNSF